MNVPQENCVCGGSRLITIDIRLRAARGFVLPKISSDCFDVLDAFELDTEAAFMMPDDSCS